MTSVLRPLAVDLDGTVIKTDLLWESFIHFIRRNPLSVFRIFFWLYRGRAYLKSQLADTVDLDFSLLPYNSDVIDFLRSEKQAGRTIVLATASNIKLAQKVADHLQLFSRVFASSDEVNLKGRTKHQILFDSLGDYDYIGDSSSDIPIWVSLGRAIVVDNGKVKSHIPSSVEIVHIFPGSRSNFMTVMRSLRIYQWVKNVLLFLPLLLSHRFFELDLIFNCILGFVSFSFAASSMYVLNDLLDVQNDRKHATKRNRPFASGALSIRSGFILFFLLLLTTFTLAFTTHSLRFQLAVTFYLVATISYSLFLKRLVVWDVIMLAGFYTVRILAGGYVANVPPSQWLLSFSTFFFLSLAFVKRFEELRSVEQDHKSFLSGRGYRKDDLPLVGTFGATSGYVSVLIFTLYLNSSEVASLYQHPTLLWLVGVCLLFWITRLWIITFRGQMTDDPVVFAMKDRFSYAIGTVIFALLFLATQQWNLRY